MPHLGSTALLSSHTRIGAGFIEHKGEVLESSIRAFLRQLSMVLLYVIEVCLEFTGPAVCKCHHGTELGVGPFTFKSFTQWMELQLAIEIFNVILLSL